MNNTALRLDRKERFLPCNLLMKTQQFLPTAFAYESPIYFRPCEDAAADSLADVLIGRLKGAAETSGRSDPYLPRSFTTFLAREKYRKAI